MMSETLVHLTAHRSWWVRDIAVWGTLGAATIDLVANEPENGSQRIMYFRFAIGGSEQDLFYRDLLDHRGNALPDAIDQPLVVVIPKNATAGAVIGKPTATSCKIARPETADHNGLIDLWIVEMGS